MYLIVLSTSALVGIFLFCFCFFPLQLSPSFTPTSVIRKMYATKDKSRDESIRLDAKDEASAYTQDGKKHEII